MTKIAIIHYSLYGHVATMSEAVKKGVLAADPSIQCDIFQVAETLPDEVLEKMYAPPKGNYPIISKDQMPAYDGFLFGISGRYGMISAQMKVPIIAIAFHRSLPGS
jgi:NAD(P)H dehydrogenase (quinone)